MGQDDSGQGNKPAGRTVTFKRGSLGSGNVILYNMNSLMPVGFSHVFIYE